jgi:hypothetical protein
MAQVGERLYSKREVQKNHQNHQKKKKRVNETPFFAKKIWAQWPMSIITAVQEA